MEMFHLDIFKIKYLLFLKDNIEKWLFFYIAQDILVRQN